MILTTFNSLISSNTLALEELKSKAKDSVSKQIKTEILSQLPTQESLRTQFSIRLNTNEDLLLVEQKFKTLKTRCNFLKDKVDLKIKQIESIQNKIKDIENRFDKLDEVITIANQLVGPLNIIISTAPTILSTFTGLLANGLAITKVDDGLKQAKSKIKELNSVVEVLASIKSYISSQINPIKLNCVEALGILNRLRSQIEAICIQLDEIFLKLLSRFPDTPIIDSDTQTDTTLPIIEKPEEILDNLENSSKQLFIQYLRDIENNTGYRIVKL